MKTTDQEGIDELPVSPVLSPIRDRGYGSVAGLDDEELASPAELERQVYEREFGPILALPVKKDGGTVADALIKVGSLIALLLAGFGYGIVEAKVDAASATAEADIAGRIIDAQTAKTASDALKSLVDGEGPGPNRQ